MYARIVLAALALGRASATSCATRQNTYPNIGELCYELCPASDPSQRIQELEQRVQELGEELKQCQAATVTCGPPAPTAEPTGRARRATTC